MAERLRQLNVPTDEKLLDKKPQRKDLGAALARKVKEYEQLSSIDSPTLLSEEILYIKNKRIFYTILAKIHEHRKFLEVSEEGLDALQRVDFDTFPAWLKIYLKTENIEKLISLFSFQVTINATEQLESAKTCIDCLKWYKLFLTSCDLTEYPAQQTEKKLTQADEKILDRKRTPELSSEEVLKNKHYRAELYKSLREKIENHAIPLGVTEEGLHELSKTDLDDHQWLQKYWSQESHQTLIRICEIEKIKEGSESKKFNQDCIDLLNKELSLAWLECLSVRKSIPKVSLAESKVFDSLTTPEVIFGRDEVAQPPLSSRQLIEEIKKEKKAFYVRSLQSFTSENLAKDVAGIIADYIIPPPLLSSDSDDFKKFKDLAESPKLAYSKKDISDMSKIFANYSGLELRDAKWKIASMANLYTLCDVISNNPLLEYIILVNPKLTINYIEGQVFKHKNHVDHFIWELLKRIKCLKLFELSQLLMNGHGIHGCGMDIKEIFNTLGKIQIEFLTLNNFNYIAPDLQKKMEGYICSLLKESKRAKVVNLTQIKIPIHSLPEAFSGNLEKIILNHNVIDLKNIRKFVNGLNRNKSLTTISLVNLRPPKMSYIKQDFPNATSEVLAMTGLAMYDPQDSKLYEERERYMNAIYKQFQAYLPALKHIMQRNGLSSRPLTAFLKTILPTDVAQIVSSYYKDNSNTTEQEGIVVPGFNGYYHHWGGGLFYEDIMGNYTYEENDLMAALGISLVRNRSESKDTLRKNLIAVINKALSELSPHHIHMLEEAINQLKVEHNPIKQILNNSPSNFFGFLDRMVSSKRTPIIK